MTSKASIRSFYIDPGIGFQNALSGGVEDLSRWVPEDIAFLLELLNVERRKEN